jgi:hypothetical protein
MVQTETTPVSTLTLVGTFVGLFCGLAALVLLVVYFVNFDSPSMGVVVTFVAAMATAQIWVNKEKTAPESKRAWRLALICGVLASAISAALLALSLLVDPALLSELQADTDASAILAVLAVAVILLNVLIIRFGLWFGARQALKALAKA